MESVKAWKDLNTLKTSPKEPVRREYAIYSFDPEEVHDFFIWGGWNEGYEDRFLINSDRFKNREDAIESLEYFNGLDEIQIIAYIDQNGKITPLIGREATDPETKWIPYDELVSTNSWFY